MIQSLISRCTIPQLRLNIISIFDPPNQTTMRKTALIAILALSLNLPSNAQRNYLGLSFGGSIPSEEFAKKDLLQDGGFAQNGFVIEFAGAYIFDYYFGIAGTATFSNNEPDRAAYAEQIQELFPGTIPEDVIVNINMGNWLYTNIMAGPMLTIPVTIDAIINGIIIIFSRLMNISPRNFIYVTFSCRSTPASTPAIRAIRIWV